MMREGLMKTSYWIMGSVLFPCVRWAAACVFALAACIPGANSAEELKPIVTRVAPGVFRIRAGEPEKIVPSMVRAAAREDALAALPSSNEPPFSPDKVKFWRMARGCRIELPLSASESIYGLGLQCKHLEQNGWRRTLYTASGDDNGKGMSHAPVPFYVSSAGYGVLVDSARYLTFSVGEKQRLADFQSLAVNSGEQKLITDVAELYGPEQRDKTSVYVDVPAARGVDVYLFAGPRMGQAVARYNLFSGGGCLPLLAAVGPEFHVGTMLDGNAVLKTCAQLKPDGMPTTSIAMEPNWQTHAYSNSYLWNRKGFPEGFTEAVRALGYDVTLWCQLYLHPSSPLIPLLGKNFGDFEVWQGMVPDMANPKVRDIYRDFLVDQFISKGVAGFKLDEVDGSPNTSPAFQEWMFPEFTSFPSGADGDQLRNLLGRLGMQAVEDAYRSQNRRTLGLVRAMHAWAAPLSVAVYSDEYSFPDYMRYNLSAGVQGLLWTPEVRHADNERDWARRVAASAFSARMTYNFWQFPHPAWKQPVLAANERGDLLPADNPYSRIARRFSRLRMALLPYIYSAYGDYHFKGIPPVRPLVCDWPEDASTRRLDDEWMLGPSILVAPLTDEGAFSELHQVELKNAAQVKADRGVGMQFQDGALSLEIASPSDGLLGGTMELDLKPGRCVARMSVRGEIGLMSLRLRRVETNREVDVRELYQDTIRLDSEGWKELIFRFQVPAAGHYRLTVSKGYRQHLSAPKRLELRNLSFVQPMGTPRESSQRLVYLPAGVWRDFWTAQRFEGGRFQAVATTPECPAVFVRDGTLLPLAEPLLTMDDKTVFHIHLAAYGENPRPCELLEDDGVSFDYEKGKWAIVSVSPDGSIKRPNHGQPERYRISGKSEEPQALIEALLNPSAP